MFHTALASTYRRWRIRSLRAKLLVPVVGLMLVSLAASTLAFVAVTALTRDQLLDQQIDADAQRVTEAMVSRVESAATAAALLAGDPNIIAAVQKDTEDAVGVLNGRAVLVRNRFDLDLIQIYNQEGEARTNLTLASLYRESSLLEYAQTDTTVTQVVDGRPLLLSRVEMPDAMGTVIVGIDLETELHRIVSRYRLSSDLGLRVGSVRVGTRPDLVFAVPAGRVRGQYSQHVALALDEMSVDLLLVRSTGDIERITTTGLMVMIGSTLLTLLLLTGLSVFITRAIARPILQLSTAATTLARGDLGRHVKHVDLACALGIGHEDEIGLLAQSFDGMVEELRSLYGNLEAKVEARTHELATSAEIARAISSRLDLEVVLKETVRLIQKRLGFYHVGIYLVEADTGMMVLRETSTLSFLGQMLKSQGFQILVGSKCPVGIAAATGRPSVVSDVRAEPAHLKPPLLLDTYSAAAMPLLVEDKVIGVLDVQSKHEHAFAPDILKLLSALSDQVAMGVHNAQLYAQQIEMVKHLAGVDRLKTEFLAIISHELRTPLNSIIGFSGILLKGLDGPLTEAQSHDLQIIKDSGEHLLSLIQDILDVSQINAGKVELEYEEIDLQEFVQGMLNAVSAMVAEKPISLQEEIDPDLPPLYADKRRVRQIMLNLLSNAVKFTKEGQIVVQARVVEALNASTEQIEPFLEVRVSDTGIGIPKDKQGDIFKEFVMVDGSSSRCFEGVGLGLPITKKLVELHGGRMWLKSEPGRGSTFAFILPLIPPRDRDIQPRGVIETGKKKEGELSYA